MKLSEINIATANDENDDWAGEIFTVYYQVYSGEHDVKDPCHWTCTCYFDEFDAVNCIYGGSRECEDFDIHDTCDEDGCFC